MVDANMRAQTSCTRDCSVAYAASLSTTKTPSLWDGTMLAGSHARQNCVETSEIPKTRALPSIAAKSAGVASPNRHQ